MLKLRFLYKIVISVFFFPREYKLSAVLNNIDAPMKHFLFKMFKNPSASSVTAPISVCCWPILVSVCVGGESARGAHAVRAAGDGHAAAAADRGSAADARRKGKVLSSLFYLNMNHFPEYYNGPSFKVSFLLYI